MGLVQLKGVKVCLSRSLPQTHQLLSAPAVEVISARSMFGEEFPGDFYRWKIEAFKIILKTADRNVTGH